VRVSVSVEGWRKVMRLPKREKNLFEGITPEMLDAGEWALVTHDPDHFSREEIVASIWQAMSAKSTEVDRPAC
jgi:hypothetical protein